MNSQPLMFWQRHQIFLAVVVAHCILLALAILLPSRQAKVSNVPSMMVSLLPSLSDTHQALATAHLARPEPRPRQESHFSPTDSAVPAATVASMENGLSNAPATTSSTTNTPNQSEGHHPISAPRFDADYLNNPAPAYPPLSRRMGEEGRVVINVTVGRNGLPINLSITHSSGSTRLDSAALNAVEKWKFVPALESGIAVQARVNVPILFKLDR